MNGNDSTTTPPPPSGGRRPKLPKIVSLKVERVKYEPPSFKFVKSIHEGVEDAIAIVIEVDAPLLLARDATPVLYVGELELSHAEHLGGTRYRYLAFGSDEKGLRSEAPVSLGWPGEKPHQQTQFRFKGSEDRPEKEEGK